MDLQSIASVHSAKRSEKPEIKRQRAALCFFFYKSGAAFQ
jgi:hypothetical protein